MEELTPLRLQKYLSMCGFTSRRNAEKMILDGQITINGQKATLGDKVLPGRDTVLCAGKEVRFSPSEEKHYYLMNKPSGYVTTVSDEKNRKTVMELLPEGHTRVYPVGRLDMYSDGLLLFTDDGDLTNVLTHPSHEITKTYRLFVKGKLSSEEVARLEEPMTLDGYALRPVQATLEKNHVFLGTTETTAILVTLSEGRNRQIRKMCEQLGFTVVKLTRISLGSIRLGRLPVGQVRTLTKSEIDYLKNLSL